MATFAKISKQAVCISITKTLKLFTVGLGWLRENGPTDNSDSKAKSVSEHSLVELKNIMSCWNISVKLDWFNNWTTHVMFMLENWNGTQYGNMFATEGLIELSVELENIISLYNGNS